MPQMFSFPAISKDHRPADLMDQMDKVGEEFNEAYLEVCKDTSKTRIAVELFDVIHAAETALRMIQEETPGAVVGAFFMCKSKNESRGYYGTQD